MTNCNHQFCFKCIKEMITTQAITEDEYIDNVPVIQNIVEDKRIKCPICRNNNIKFYKICDSKD